MDFVRLTINGKEVEVQEGTSILKAAEQAEINIPRLCYDDSLEPVGACRLCVVEVKGARTLIPSCVAAVTPGMVVETESPTVIKARRMLLDLLLSNHPLDCLTCDKNGDCRLQEYAYRYDVKHSSFEGEKHNYLIDDSNPYIRRDMNKCILCGKCVRTCAQVKDRKVIGFANRGFNTKITPAMYTELAESDCVSCARCLVVCPVGALTYNNLAGKGRTYEIRKERVTCSFCDAGCQFDLNYKGEQVIGVTAGAPGEGRPLCLKGRLGMELLYNDNPPTPMLKKDDQFVEVSWVEALGMEGLLKKLMEQD
ncbi:MAG: NADP-reducing hydrogenase subunit HndC [Pelotomaculum sp. PtaB.Bin104]|nr:MAG: NADP-reducing hydrogenase subunit HndC [Pelotomaculum sp. PtaB.Bin104]